MLYQTLNFMGNGNGKEIIGLRGVVDLVDKIGPVPSSVVINGETGTGKELVAKRIHKISKRAGKFVAVNCAAIPEGLVESELFGHIKGAFTDAKADRVGAFEHADKGTIFLDEISDLPLYIQAKILRVLQEREVQPLGQNKNIPIDVRVIAASNKSLRAEVDASRFRADLYYRLSVLVIELPPLRERGKDEKRELINHFIAKYGQIKGDGATTVSGISDEALEVLLLHPWPGNVRELENVIERASVYCDGEKIYVVHLPTDPDNAIKETRIVQSNLTGNLEDVLKKLSIPDDGVVPFKDFARNKRRVFLEMCQKHTLHDICSAFCVEVVRAVIEGKFLGKRKMFCETYGFNFNAMSLWVFRNKDRSYFRDVLVPDELVSLGDAFQIDCARFKKFYDITRLVKLIIISTLREHYTYAEIRPKARGRGSNNVFDQTVDLLLAAELKDG